MKRVIAIAAGIIICFLLQSTVFEWLAIANVSPNLLIVLTAAVGFMRGRKAGLLTGFFCGLLMDIMSGNIIGLFALIYTLTGYINGLFQKSFYPENIKLPIASVLLSDFLINLVIYAIGFLTRGRFSFGYYLTALILPELVYTAITGVVLYLILLRVDRWLDDSDSIRAVGE